MKRFRGLFAAEGLDPERLIVEGAEELGVMMGSYGAIDIALDPTPYNGGTTTLGRPEWIADNEGQFRAIALQLAEALPGLRQWRAAPRARMAQSGLADQERYTADFEHLPRRMWRHHCQGRDERLDQQHRP